MKYLHTMIRIRDIDASLRFFCEGLGLVVKRRNDYPEGKFTLIFLAAPDSPDAEVELTYNWPAEDGSAETYSGGRNFGHLAFRVDDIAGMTNKLRAAGVTLFSDPVKVPPGVVKFVAGDKTLVYFLDPDGVILELAEYQQS